MADDITIVPAGSKSYERSARIAPVYLVKFEDFENQLTTNCVAVSFLATKIDENPHSIKMVGFEIKKDVNKICENYQEVLGLTDKSSYIELSVPWHRVIKIQNLIFKQK